MEKVCLIEILKQKEREKIAFIDACKKLNVNKQQSEREKDNRKVTIKRVV